MKKIFTLGTGRRSEEDFIEILNAYNIEALIDVRSLPKSKNIHFNRGNLEELLPSEGIGYYYLGVELGGFRKGGYLAYTLTGDFMQGINRLEAVAVQMPSVIICAERLPWKCHRKWIARELHKRGWEVTHILDKGKEWTPT